MTLILHEQGRIRLMQALSSALSQFRIERGRYVARIDALGALYPVEKVLPGKGELHAQLARALSNFVASLDTARQSMFINSGLNSIQIVLSEGKKADLIFLAAQWFFDGYSDGSDQLLKFVQTMVVLEILLGDKTSSDQTGLNVLLRNRCAYLIGNSQADRAELLEWFRKIYDVRSEIVHGGKHRLSVSEYELFVRLRWICRRVIRKEIDLLKANEAST